MPTSGGSASGIRAGLAYISLTLHDAGIKQGVNSTIASLNSAASGLGKFGTGLATAAGAIGAPFVLGAKTLLGYVSQVDDAAARVGMLNQEFARLTVVANLSGGSLASAESVMQKLNEQTLKLRTGSSETADRFRRMGINITQFASSGAEKRLVTIGQALARIQDQGLRAALSMKLLGESGATMTRFLVAAPERFAELTSRMRELAITDKAFEAAARLSLEWSALKTAAIGLAASIGTTVAPALTKAAEAMTNLVLSVRLFVEENPRLVAAIGILAGIASIAASFILATAAVAKFVAVIGSLASSLGTLGPALAAIGILAAQFAGGAAAVLAVVALADAFGLVDVTIAAATRTLGLFVTGFGGLLSMLPLIGQFGDQIERIGQGMLGVTGAQVSDLRQAAAFGGGRGGGSGGFGGFGEFTSAGIIGGQASQQTLGLAGVAATTAQQSLQGIHEESKQQTQELRNLNQNIKSGTGYKAW